MDPRTKERVERWDSYPFPGGRNELTTLAHQQFSGAVEAGGAWLFLLNGRIVGVVDGLVEDVVEASGTVYDTPDPALPLLCSMQEQPAEATARYYTNETPLSEVDRTLQERNFTGYVELSEQVLSGDYYVVYYGGRRLAAAYIGNAERLLTGDEAFARADDEVGIYEIATVDVEVMDVDDATSDGRDATAAIGETSDPESESTMGFSSASIAERWNADPSPSADTQSDASDGPAEALSGNTIGGDSPAPSGVDATPDDGTAGATANVEVDDESSVTASTDDELDRASPDVTETDRQSTTETDTEAKTDLATEDEGNDAITIGDSVDHDETDARTDPADEDDGIDAVTIDGSADQEETGTTDRLDPDIVEAAAEALEDSEVPWASDDDSTATDDIDDRFEKEKQWRKTRRIPSIDPDTTGDRARTSTEMSSNSSRRRSESETDESSTTDRIGSTAGTLTVDMLEREDKIDRLTQQVTDLEERRNALATKCRELETERSHVQSANQELSATIEQLESRIEQLEAELQRPQSTGVDDGGVDTSSAGGAPRSVEGTELSQQQAISGTSLFVRYASKRQPTLVSAHGGEGNREDVVDNLLLERHTDFDADDVAISGQPYAEFLESTVSYQFVTWLVTTLLYEIRDTGQTDALGDLYDAIPQIDRVELSASISLAEDDTADVPDEVTFDVVAFDKMGSPLVVANCNDSHEPATQELLESLEETSSAVSANFAGLGAAFLVTSSFFDPDALEVTEQATSTGFLRRGSKRSYVNVSRKQGYHLCLVEARDGGFHVAVPDL